jgi:hypothetical protein
MFCNVRFHIYSIQPVLAYYKTIRYENDICVVGNTILILSLLLSQGETTQFVVIIFSICSYMNKQENQTINIE